MLTDYSKSTNILSYLALLSCVKQLYLVGIIIIPIFQVGKLQLNKV